MKNRRILTFLGIFALGGALYAGAQDYDDIYYDASKTVTKETVKKSSGSVSLTEQTQPRTVSTRVGQSTVTPVTGTARRVKIERDGYRDDDEYNRRGAYDPTALNDTTYINEDGSFSNTQRIERFYNPDIIIASNDDELITLYYEDQPTVNLIIGSNWGPSWGWGSSWAWSSFYYDPWYYNYYYPFYTWYGPSWHYGWHHGLYGWGYWDSWHYRPWGYHYGWNHWGGYGWHHGYNSWDRGWRRDHGGYNHANGRRPSSVGRGYGYNRGGAGTTGVRSNGGIGRRPSNGGIINSDRSTTRPGVRYSGSTNYGGTRGGSGIVGGHRSPSTGNVGTSSGIGRSTRPSSTPSRSYSGGSSSSGRSYSGGSSSSGRSYSGSSNIGGGRSSGGYSGGGGHSGGHSGGGGGGHRR